MGHRPPERRRPFPPPPRPDYQPPGFGLPRFGRRVVVDPWADDRERLELLRAVVADADEDTLDGESVVRCCREAMAVMGFPSGVMTDAPADPKLADYEWR